MRTLLSPSHDLGLIEPKLRPTNTHYLKVAGIIM
jgi:hypothetical protein